MRKWVKYILSEFGGKVAKREEIKKACKRFKVGFEKAINYMISYGYLIRILRGIYYVKTIEEFKLKKSLNTLKIISLGMEKLKIKWYFGLYTALELNGATHEYFPVIYVLNNAIYRPKTININGEETKFIKVKKELFNFGIVEKNGVKFSDIEKTLLDIVYLERYRSVPEERLSLFVEEYRKKVRKRKIVKYLKFYPSTVSKVIKAARVI